MIPVYAPDQRVLRGPTRVGSEQRFLLQLGDGSRVVLGQLLPELASSEPLRRRYVRDIERLQALDAPALARTLVLGPAPDPRDPAAAPPYRVREEPEGEDLESLLARRAPLPVGEAVALGIALCEALRPIHERGVVLRDLQPRYLVATAGGLRLTDVGLARVDLLSSRTAASLLLEASPCASPEQLLKTTLDPRSDLYAVGVILWQALTGALPFADAARAPLARRHALPALTLLRPQVPEVLAALLHSCLAEAPEGRPASATQVARVLRGEETLGAIAHEESTCQGCGARLWLGQRLCLSCGQEAVQLFHTSAIDPEREHLDLLKVSEDAAFLGTLRAELQRVSAAPPPPLNFIIGDARMYSKEERARRLRVPVRLFTDLEPATARRLEQRLQGLGFKVRRGSQRAIQRAGQRRLLLYAGLLLLPIIGLAAGTSHVWTWLLTTTLVFMATVIGVVEVAKRKALRAVGGLYLPLRPAPAALPASDPLVARVARLLRPASPLPAPAADVQELLREVALLLQVAVDARARDRYGEAPQAELEALLGLVEAEVGRLAQLDPELAGLSEGNLVRALAQSEARGEPPFKREPLLEGLDRLRALEDQRGAAMQRLLEAAALLRRAVALAPG